MTLEPETVVTPGDSTHKPRKLLDQTRAEKLHGKSWIDLKPDYNSRRVVAEPIKQALGTTTPPCGTLQTGLHHRYTSGSVSASTMPCRPEGKPEARPTFHADARYNKKACPSCRPSRSVKRSRRRAPLQLALGASIRLDDAVRATAV